MSLLNILFYVLVCYYAIRCVKKMNKETLCFGVTQVTSIKMYFYYLIFSFALSVFALVRTSIWVKDHSSKSEFNDSKFAKSSAPVGGKGSEADFYVMTVIYLSANVTMIFLTLGALYLTYQLNEILKVQMRERDMRLGTDVGQKLTIFPGFAVISSYDHPKVNRLMTVQLRIAFAFSALQIIVAVFSGVSFHKLDVILSSINIFFYAMSLRCAIRCVKKTNKLAWCFFVTQVPSIKMYSYYLYMSFFLTIFGFVRICLWISSNNSHRKYNNSKFAQQSGPAGGSNSFQEFVAIAVMYVFVYCCFSFISLYQMYIAHVLNKILAQEQRDTDAVMGNPHCAEQKLTIVMGFAVMSAYPSPEVNTLGQQVIRLSFGVTVVQVGMAIFESVSNYAVDYVLAIVNILFYLGTLRYCIRLMTKKNKDSRLYGLGWTLSSAQMYLILLGFALTLTVVGLVRTVVWVGMNASYRSYNDSKFSKVVGPAGGEDSESEFAVLAASWIAMYCLLVVCILAQFFLTSKLSHLLVKQILPVNEPIG